MSAVKLEKNVPTAERFVRVAVGVGLIATGAVALPALWAVLPALAGAVLVFSGTIGFCHVKQFLAGRRRTRR